MINCYCGNKLALLEDEENILTPFYMYECPEVHAQVCFDKNNKIVKYAVFWDEDEVGDIRYLLQSSTSASGTKLHKKSYRFKTPWQIILNIEHFIPLNVQDNTMQFQGMISRLQKLKAFI